MIKKLTIRDLTDLEKKRFKQFRNSHRNANCYYTTNFTFGVGYDIIATTLTIKTYKDLTLVNSENTKFITDEEKELELI